MTEYIEKLSEGLNDLVKTIKEQNLEKVELNARLQELGKRVAELEDALIQVGRSTDISMVKTIVSSVIKDEIVNRENACSSSMTENACSMADTDIVLVEGLKHEKPLNTVCFKKRTIEGEFIEYCKTYDAYSFVHDILSSHVINHGQILICGEPIFSAITGINHLVINPNMIVISSMITNNLFLLKYNFKLKNRQQMLKGQSYEYYTNDKGFGITLLEGIAPTDMRLYIDSLPDVASKCIYNGDKFKILNYESFIKKIKAMDYGLDIPTVATFFGNAIFDGMNTPLSFKFPDMSDYFYRNFRKAGFDRKFIEELLAIPGTAFTGRFVEDAMSGKKFDDKYTIDMVCFDIYKFIDVAKSHGWNIKFLSRHLTISNFSCMAIYKTEKVNQRIEVYFPNTPKGKYTDQVEYFVKNMKSYDRVYFSGNTFTSYKGDYPIDVSDHTIILN